MRVCITGAKGQLGRALGDVFEEDEFYPLGKEELDITNIEQAREKLERINPKVIIHTAAYTDVEGCEKHKEKAYRINYVGTENIAKIAKDLGSKMIYISTDYVFDGKKESPYGENDMPNPINIYGKSKYEGEIAVKNILQDYCIVRTAWLYGSKGKNFVETILNLTTSNSMIKVVEDQQGCPTYTYDLAVGIKSLLETDVRGIYHLTNEGNCTWYEFAKAICEIKGLNVKVMPISTEEARKIAKRPSNSALKNSSPIKLRNWRKALEEYLLKDR